jgi:uncharacterized protein (DUF302 family)
MNPPLTELTSPHTFQTTLDRIAAAISAAGLTLFARIDHAAGARSAGLEMPPSVVLIYGHARGGTPIMQAAPNAALDLPLRVLVRQADGHAVVAFHPIAPLLQAAGVPEALAARLQPAQQLLVAAVAP